MKFGIENDLIPKILIEIPLSLQYTDQMFQIPIYFLNYRYNFTCMGSSYPWAVLQQIQWHYYHSLFACLFLSELFVFCFWFCFHYAYVPRLSEFYAAVYLFPLKASGLLFAVVFLPIRNEKFVFFVGVLPGNKLLLESSYCRFHVQ